MSDKWMMTEERHDSLARARLEDAERWREAIGIAPVLHFPRGWGVKVIPPFAGALMRFIVYKGEANVSVYADYHEALGYFGEPHWEIYPGPSGENDRYALADTETLIREIGKSLAKQNRDAARDASHD